jgi:hypothetical protein
MENVDDPPTSHIHTIRSMKVARLRPIVCMIWQACLPSTICIMKVRTVVIASSFVKKIVLLRQLYELEMKNFECA